MNEQVAEQPIRRKHVDRMQLQIMTFKLSPDNLRLGVHDAEALRPTHNHNHNPSLICLRFHRILPCAKRLHLHHPPKILQRTTKLAARNTGAQAVLADTDLLIHHSIGKVVLSMSHGTYEHGDTASLRNRREVATQPLNRTIEGEGDFVRVGWEVIRDGILDDPQKLFATTHAADAELVQKLDHESGETFEGSRNAHVRVDFDENTTGGVDVDLEETGFVERRVEEGEEALVGDVRTCFGDVAAHFGEHALVIIAV